MLRVLLLTILAAAALAEPPVDQQNSLTPSSQYGPPPSTSNQFSTQFGSQTSQFGASGAERPLQSDRFSGSDVAALPGGYPSPGYPAAEGNGFNGEENTEPANYEFQYDIEDQEQALKFGHQESRQGDVAIGSYYVLLPDGRTQHVEYQADQNGYKPKISYEEPQGGYARGPSGAGNGYNNGGYEASSQNGGYQFRR